MSANESSQTSSLIDECWINWFCGLNGNQFFCEVEKGFIEDSFNLFGLKHYVSKDFNKVLDTILDRLGKLISPSWNALCCPISYFSICCA